MALTAAGSVVFAWHPLAQVGAGQQVFYPVAYALDVLVPVVDLGDTSGPVVAGPTWIAVTYWVLVIAG